MFVAIDVAKDRLDVHLRPAAEAFAVDRNGPRLAALAQRLAAIGPTLVVLEATGGFEIAVAASGLPLALVNPRQTRDFARATGRLANTNRRSGSPRLAGEWASSDLGDDDGEAEARFGPTLEIPALRGPSSWSCAPRRALPDCGLNRASERRHSASYYRSTVTVRSRPPVRDGGEQVEAHILA